MSNAQMPTKQARTLLTSLLLSSPGPIVTGIAAATSQSATQLADFIRRTMELVALFVAWWVYRKREGRPSDDALRLRLERMANVSVTASMACSGVAMLIVGTYRLFVYSPSGNVTLGLAIAVMGALVNAAFWWRYRGFLHHSFDAVIDGQRRLYRAKTLVDLCVVIALATVAIVPTHPATRYVDAAGSIIVPGEWLYQAFAAAQQSRRPERDRARPHS